MNPRVLLGVCCLVAGVLLAAWSLASGHVLLSLAGFAMIFAFLYLAMEAMAKAGKSRDSIKPAANAAWSMKNEPPSGSQSEGPR